MDPCARCGFDYQLAAAEDASTGISAGAEQLANVLTRTDLDLVRDVLLVQRERVLAARRTDRPTFEPMGRDERVEHDGYAGQDPAAVARQLRDAAAMFVNDLARLQPDEWERTLMYNYPVEMERSLRWVAEHTEHEVQHHLLDVREQLN